MVGLLLAVGIATLLAIILSAGYALVLRELRQIKELGETGEGLTAIEHWRAALCLSDAERAALEWAEFVTRIADGAPPDAAFAALRHHFDDRQIVDLTAIIANMNSLNRMAISFQLEAPPSQVTDKI